MLTPEWFHCLSSVSIVPALVHSCSRCIVLIELCSREVLAQKPIQHDMCLPSNCLTRNSLDHAICSDSFLPCRTRFRNGPFFLESVDERVVWICCHVSRMIFLRPAPSIVFFNVYLLEAIIKSVRIYIYT